MTLYIIANPHAGNHGAKQVISDIEKHHTSDICTLLTRYKNDELHQVERLLKTFDPEKDKLLIVGGDGTLSKVLYHLPVNLPFAYYPVGSGNDFAHALGIVPNLEALLVSLTNQPKGITVYSYQEGLVLNSLDLGFAAWVVNQAANSTLKTVLNKYHLGKLTYIATAIQFLLKNPLQASVSLESSEGDNLTLGDHFFFSLANNTYFGGGIMIWPTVTVHSENLECVYAKGETFFQRLTVLLSLVLKRHEKSSYLNHCSLKQVTVNFPKESLIEIDGEVVSLNEITLSPQKRYIYL
ncbi:diacylglycerol/lipid kinase family protein [Streptococcus gallolyticus subsp. gallolyticus]